jgi:hypothetical protein
MLEEKPPLKPPEAIMMALIATGFREAKLDQLL